MLIMGTIRIQLQKLLSAQAAEGSAEANVDSQKRGYVGTKQLLFWEVRTEFFVVSHLLGPV